MKKKANAIRWRDFTIRDYRKICKAYEESPYYNIEYEDKDYYTGSKHRGITFTETRTIRVYETRFHHMMKYFIKYYSPDMRIIDLGCFPGNMLRLIKYMYKRVELYGAGIKMPNRFEKYMNSLGIKTIEYNLDPYIKHEMYKEIGGIPIHFAEKYYSSFDYIICTEVLEHLFTPLNLIREAYKILKPGGVLLLTTPNPRVLGRILDLIKGEELRNITLERNYDSRDLWNPHVRFYGVNYIEYLFEKNSFQLLDKVYFNENDQEYMINMDKKRLMMKRIITYLCPYIREKYLLTFQKI